MSKSVLYFMRQPFSYWGFLVSLLGFLFSRFLSSFSLSSQDFQVSDHVCCSNLSPFQRSVTFTLTSKWSIKTLWSKWQLKKAIRSLKNFHSTVHDNVLSKLYQNIWAAVYEKLILPRLLYRTKMERWELVDKFIQPWFIKRSKLIFSHNETC